MPGPTLIWVLCPVAAVSGLGVLFLVAFQALSTLGLINTRESQQKPQAAMARLIWNQRFKGCGKTFATRTVEFTN